MNSSVLIGIVIFFIFSGFSPLITFLVLEHLDKKKEGRS